MRPPFLLAPSGVRTQARETGPADAALWPGRPVNSLFRTGFGATALTGPVSPEVASANWTMLVTSRRVHPGHPLPAVAQPSARAQLEGQRHPRQRPAVRREDDSESQAHHARAEFGPARGFRFPFAAKPGKKIVSRGACLRESFIAAVAVVTDGRCRNDYARRPLQFGKLPEQVPCGVDPAAPQQFLARRVPSASGDGRPREMNERVRALGARRVELARNRVPCDGLRGRTRLRFFASFRAAPAARSNGLAPPAFQPAPFREIRLSPETRMRIREASRHLFSRYGAGTCEVK